MGHANNLMTVVIDISPPPTYYHSMFGTICGSLDTPNADDSFATFEGPSPVVPGWYHLLKLLVEIADLAIDTRTNQAFGKVIGAIIKCDNRQCAAVPLDVIPTVLDECLG